MPRREGEVFRLGTAITVSSRGVSGAPPRMRGARKRKLRCQQGRAYRGWGPLKLGRRPAKIALFSAGPAHFARAIRHQDFIGTKRDRLLWSAARSGMRK